MREKNNPAMTVLDRTFVIEPHSAPSSQQWEGKSGQQRAPYRLTGGSGASQNRKGHRE